MENDEKLERRNASIFALSLTALFFWGIISGVNSCNAYGKNHRIEYRELSNLGKRSLSIAAGNDRVLSNKEKRRFLEEVGLMHVVLDESQKKNQLFIEPLPFLPNEVYTSGANIVLGRDLRNDEGILSTNAEWPISDYKVKGTYLGFVPKKTLIDYVERHG